MPHDTRLVLSTLFLTAALSACGPQKVEQTVVLHDYAFEPATFEVPANAQVTVKIINHTNHEHSWSLMEKDYDLVLPFEGEDNDHVLESIDIDVGSRESLVFTAPSEPGEYTILCTFPGHAMAGMVGTLVVK